MGNDITNNSRRITPNMGDEHLGKDNLVYTMPNAPRENLGDMDIGNITPAEYFVEAGINRGRRF